MPQLLAFFLGPIGRYALIGILALGVLGYARESGRRSAVAACAIKLQTLDTKWRREVEEANRKAQTRVQEALAEAESVAPTPSIPAELVRLCRDEPAGCRTRNP